MFDFVRKHNKWMMVLMFALIIPSFVFFGIEGYQRMMDSAHVAVASVGGHKITQADWDNAHRQAMDQVRTAQPNVDPQLLDSPEAKYLTLERLVQQRVLADAVGKFKLYASDQSLGKTLLSDPSIAALRGPDGKLDHQRYAQMLKAQGMTPEGYEASVRAQLSQQQVIAGVANASGWIAPDAANLVTNPFFERRAVQVAEFRPADFVARAVPGADDLKTYYNAHAAQFKSTEQASVEYLVLDLPAIEKHINLPEQDLKSYYEQNKSRYAAKEERRASHILIAASPKADAAARDAARKKAEDLLADIRKNPASFAELAQKHSQDPGSAQKGGDLGFFERGTMTKPFADAVFSMKQGETSNLVQTDFGYHIIQLTGVRGGDVQGFDAVKAQIEAELKKQQAQQKFAEAAEALKEDVFKNPNDLKAVADKLGLPLQTASGVEKTPAATTQGALANRNLLQALFSPESVSKKQNINPVEIGVNQLAAGRIVSYSPAEQKPLDAVKEQVGQAWTRDKAAELAKAAGMAKLKEWAANPAAASTMPAEITVSRAQPAQQAAAVVNAAMRADRGKLPAFEGADLGAQGYAVVRVNQVLEPDATVKARQAQQAPMVAQAMNEAQFEAYYQSLKDALKVKIMAPKPAPGLAAAAAAAPAN